MKKLTAALLLPILMSCQQQLPKYDNEYITLKEEVSQLNTRLDSLIAALEPKPVTTHKKLSKKKPVSRKEVTVQASQPKPLPAYESPSSSSRTTYKSSSYSGRCQATTKKGTQCKRSASSGSNYCWQH